MNATRMMQGWVNALVEPLGAGGSRALFGILGVLLLGGTLWACVRGRAGVFRGLFGFFAGLLLLALAWDLSLFAHLGKISFLARIRLAMGVLSFSVLVVTLESIRRTHLQERYALLWVSTGIVILLCATFTSVLDFFCALFGLQYVTFVVAIIFSFLLLVVFHFSIALSALTDDRSRLAQRCAQLDARLGELEKRMAARPQDHGDEGGAAPSDGPRRDR